MYQSVTGDREALVGREPRQVCGHDAPSRKAPNGHFILKALGSYGRF